MDQGIMYLENKLKKSNIEGFSNELSLLKRKQNEVDRCISKYSTASKNLLEATQKSLSKPNNAKNYFAAYPAIDQESSYEGCYSLPESLKSQNNDFYSESECSMEAQRIGASLFGLYKKDETTGLGKCWTGDMDKFSNLKKKGTKLKTYWKAKQNGISESFDSLTLLHNGNLILSKGVPLPDKSNWYWNTNSAINQINTSYQSTTDPIMLNKKETLKNIQEAISKVKCGTDSVLQGLEYRPSEEVAQFSYTCGNLETSESVENMNENDFACDVNEYISSINMQTGSFNCKKAIGEGDCSNEKMDQTIVKCAENQALNSLKVKIDDNNNILYDYKCCNNNVNRKNKLILTDSGNLEIQNENETIWSTNYKESTTTFPVKKWKQLGKKLLDSGNTLNLNDWIVSDSSNYIALLCDKDFKLVKCISRCSEGSGGNQYGEENGLALYSIEKQDVSNLNKIALIEDQNYYTYSSSSKTNSFDNLPNLNSSGYTIETKNQGLEQCKVDCFNDNKCKGFVVDKQTNSCELKRKIYPNVPGKEDPNSTIYYLNKKVEGDNGCPTEVENVSLNKFNELIGGLNYKGNVTKELNCGVKKDSNDEIKELRKIKDELRLKLTSLVGEMDILIKQNKKYKEGQIENSRELEHQLKEYKKILQNMKSEKKFDYNTANVQEKDRQIKLTTNQYEYIFWSVGALATLLVTLKMLRT